MWVGGGGGWGGGGGGGGVVVGRVVRFALRLTTLRPLRIPASGAIPAAIIPRAVRTMRAGAFRAGPIVTAFRAGPIVTRAFRAGSIVIGPIMERRPQRRLRPVMVVIERRVDERAVRRVRLVVVVVERRTDGRVIRRVRVVIGRRAPDRWRPHRRSNHHHRSRRRGNRARGGVRCETHDDRWCLGTVRDHDSCAEVCKGRIEREMVHADVRERAADKRK